MTIISKAQAIVAGCGRAIWSRLRRPGLAEALVVLGIAGLCARIVIAYHSLGSNDIITWKIFGKEIWRRGIGAEYETNSYYNHPPAIGVAASWLYAFAGKIGARFEIIFKLPSIAADALSGWLVARSWGVKGRTYAAGAFAVFCWNPVSILITGYHGNTDSICAALTLLAAVLVDSELAGLGGLVLGASINIKLIPILLIPILLSCLRTKRQLLRFSLALSAGALPFLPIVWSHWKTFYENVLVYHSFPGEWGITEIGRQLGDNPRFKEKADAFNIFWIEKGSLFLVAFSVLFGVFNAWKRRFGATAGCAAMFAAFLVLAPGWGVQYAVYLVPLLFANHLGWAITYSTVTGLYLLYVYVALLTKQELFYSEFTNFYHGQPIGARHLGGIAWTVTVVILVRLLRRPRPPQHGHLPRAPARP